jgi:hypothetical protein
MAPRAKPAKPKKTKPRTKAESAGTAKTRRASPKTVNAEDRAKIKADYAARQQEDANEPVYDPEIARVILDHLSDGETLNEVCRRPGMPKASTVRRWSLDDVGPGFAAQYTRARELGYLAMADDMTDIMDDGRNDWMARQLDREGDDSPAKVAWQINGEHVSRSRLRFEGRKWLLAKALPKIFGDKVAVTDADGGKLVIEFVT